MIHPVVTKISIYIKELRERLGLKQGPFGELIGKDRTTVNKYESGRVIPPGDVLLRMQDLDSKLK
jgi:DNA-binding transcriptional regulator YiaG